MPPESPFYPDTPCWRAPLRPGHAPREGCPCKVCDWANRRKHNDLLLSLRPGPIRPGTLEWDALLQAAEA